jgi:hypothetical protein
MFCNNVSKRFDSQNMIGFEVKERCQFYTLPEFPVLPNVGQPCSWNHLGI